MLKKLVCIGLSLMITITLSGCVKENKIEEYDKEEDIVNGNISTSNSDLANNKEESTSNIDIKLESIPLGAYIKYQSSNTSYTVFSDDSGYESNQIYNPSTITSWKVFANKDGQIDIISSESVGNLTLQGTTGYAKAVDTLNKMCKAYVNPVYADNGRCLGYVAGESVDILDTDTYPLEYEYIKNIKNTEIPYTVQVTDDGEEIILVGFPYTDELYKKDEKIVNTGIDTNEDGVLEYPLRHSDGYVWLASRGLEFTDLLNYRVGYMDNRYWACEHYLVASASNSGSSVPVSPTFGVRPVISLKSSLKIIGGKGTKDEPYIITTDEITNIKK